MKIRNVSDGGAALARSYAGVNVALSLHVFAHGHHGLGLATDNPTVGIWTTLCA